MSKVLIIPDVHGRPFWRKAKEKINRWSNTGSMVWSDVREGDRESTYYQIFGHTQLESEPIITDKFACLDVRRPFILDTETKKIEEYA